MKMKKKKRQVSLPKFDDLMLHPKTYRDIGPFGVCTLIDDMLRRSVTYLKKAGKKEADMREMFIRYGQCSRALNTEVREIIKKMSTPLNFLTGGVPSSDLMLTVETLEKAAEKQKDEVPFDHLLYQWKLAYSYWWNRTQFLETFQKSFLGGMTDRKDLNIGATRILRWMNLSPEQLKDRIEKETHFNDLIERMAKKTELTEIEIKEVFDGKEVTKNYDPQTKEEKEEP